MCSNLLFRNIYPKCFSREGKSKSGLGCVIEGGIRERVLDKEFKR